MYSHIKCGCKFVFSDSQFFFFCLFLPCFFFFLCFFTSQSLKTAHQVRCAARFLVPSTLLFKTCFQQEKCWDSLALLQGSFGPFGPKVATRVRNEFPGPESLGNPNGGLARKGPIGPKRALSGQFLLFPRGCGVQRNWS